MGRYLVTSALPYSNNKPHLGHIAGAYLPADVYVRYLRMCGHDVVFVCGSDDHGVPIMMSARREGVSPADIVAKANEGDLDFETPGRLGSFGAFNSVNYGFYYFDDRYRRTTRG